MISSHIEMIKQHESQLFLQSDFIPNMVAAVQADELPADALTDLNFWIRCLTDNEGKLIDYKWEELDIKVEYFDDDRAAIIYRFPKPMITPDAFYGAVVINRRRRNLTMFTLEVDFTRRQNLCIVTDDTHTKLKQYTESVSIDEFVDIVNHHSDNNKKN